MVPPPSVILLDVEVVVVLLLALVLGLPLSANAIIVINTTAIVNRFLFIKFGLV